MPLNFRWVSRGGCLRCLVAGASTGSGSSVRRFSAVPLSSTVTYLEASAWASHYIPARSHMFTSSFT